MAIGAYGRAMPDHLRALRFALASVQSECSTCGEKVPEGLSNHVCGEPSPQSPPAGVVSVDEDDRGYG